MTEQQPTLPPNNVKTTMPKELIGGIKADEKTQLDILYKVKDEYKKLIEKRREDETKDINETVGNELADVMEKFPPWLFYEDSSGNNAFRVIGVDLYETNAEKNEWSARLHVAKAVNGSIEEIVFVPPSMLKPTRGWKPTQLDLIHSCRFADGFLRPLGYIGILHIIREQTMAEIDEEDKKAVESNTGNEEPKDTNTTNNTNDSNNTEPTE
jgi:hypothetical protein